MAPTGDGDDDYRPDPPVTDKDPCNLSFTVRLTGPDPRLAKQLNPYTILAVDIATTPLRGATIEVPGAFLGVSLVGTISEDTRADDLLRCLKQKRKFRAVVQQADGGYVLVRVEPT
jgi:hypothetical protein